MHRKIGLSLLIIIAFCLFFWGAFKQAKLVNKEMSHSDQSAYMSYAKQLYSNFDLTNGDRNRMPIYPAIMSFFYKNGMTDEIFFETGKIASIFIGAAVLLIFFFLAKKQNNFFDTLIAMLVVMFSVFAFKAPFFQADVLSYGLNFIFFYLSISLLKKPGVLKSILTGVTGAVCYLTKASILPSIILVILFLIFQAFLLFKSNVFNLSKNKNIIPIFQILLTYAKYVILLVLFFIIIVFSYINKSKSVFGQYFYNVNTTFYIWYDSWEEATNGTKAYGDRIGWPTLPADQIPSLKKYVSEHSNKEIIKRLSVGYKKTFINMINSYGYHKFIFIYIFLLIILYIENNGFKHLLSIFRYQTAILLFIITYFFSHLTLYAWYTPIADGNRFVLTLLLPLMYIFVECLNYSHKHKMKMNIFGIEFNSRTISVIILFFLCSYLTLDYPKSIIKIYGGK